MFFVSFVIRVAHYGELAPECVSAYYKYGCALLYKAQEEADPLGSVPKKDTESQEGSTKGVSAKNNMIRESSTTSVSSMTAQDQKSDNQEGTIENGIYLHFTNHLVKSGALLISSFDIFMPL